jgi:predicted N-formylglutamate amidohydrolase
MVTAEVPVGASPFISVAPQGLGSIVLTCEHATNRLPFRLRRTADERRILDSHWGWDIGAWQLTRDLARGLRTSAIGGRWSRLVIDLNRRADDAGLVRSEAGGVVLSWNRDVDAPEVERRLLDYHAPYHMEVDRLIMRRLVRGVRPLLFAVHTFTPVFDGRPRRFDVGVLYERHGSLAHRLGRSLRREGLDVRYNQPYSGMAGMMYSADRHGKHHELPCLELEANHTLFDRPATARRLSRVVLRSLVELSAHLGS